MRIKELQNGNLKAHITPNDVINRLNNFSEFQISERVANILRESPHFLAEDYWYLAIGSYDKLAEHEIPTKFNWEITVRGVTLQIPIQGTIEFVDELAILA